MTKGYKMLADIGWELQSESVRGLMFYKKEFDIFLNIDTEYGAVTKWHGTRLTFKEIKAINQLIEELDKKA